MTSLGPMERKLSEMLLACAAAYCGSRRIEESTLGKMAASDARFFDRLRDPDPTFNVRTFDKVMAWFSENWPDGVRWPKGVPRPEKAAAG